MLDVLEHLAETRATATLADLSGQLAAPKSSLLPLLRTLVARGWVEQPQPAAYRLSARWSLAGMRTAEVRDLRELARPFLLRLTGETGETSFLGVLPPGSDEAVYIEKIESPQRVRYSANLGERRPLHCTAIGMAIFAFLLEESRERVLQRLSLTTFTRQTTTSRAVLSRRLDQVARAGVAVTFEEFVEGAGAIAAPVFDPRGEVIAACGIAGPTGRMRQGRVRFIAAVKTTTRLLSTALGWRPQ